MGAIHAQSVVEGNIPRCKLTAVCDPKAERLNQFSSIEGFVSVDDFLRSSETDAVLIATPHYSHTAIGIQALEAGRHVLVEKPISVHKSDAERLIAAHRGSDQVFAAMFNQRTDPFFLKLRQLVQSGDLGAIRRVSWTITNWFRTEAYYQSSDWRATWAGEGGGVLLNQCPHNLDLFQWIFGMPAKVRAFCHFGRYHDIEVEDDVTAYLEYPDGMTAVFSASTGEAPGTNRLEVAAERGKVVIENDLFLFTRNEVPMSEFSRTDPGRFSAPADLGNPNPDQRPWPPAQWNSGEFRLRYPGWNTVDCAGSGRSLFLGTGERVSALDFGKSVGPASDRRRTIRPASPEIDRFIHPTEARKSSGWSRTTWRTLSLINNQQILSR